MILEMKVFSTEQNQNIALYVRNYVISELNQIEKPIFQNNREEYDVLHDGFYIGITNKEGDNTGRVGFFRKNQTNLMNSVDCVIQELVFFVKEKIATDKEFNNSTLFFYLIKKCIIIKNPMEWDTTKDGIHFQFGNRYKGFYLPYQIRGFSQKESMDRLCSLECGVPSNFWRMPEGLITKIECDQYIG